MRDIWIGREYDLLRRYNISKQELLVLYKKQNYKCMICTREVKLVVDHSHVSGKVRGLLCSKCNRGIGFLNDDLVLLKNGIKYLKENEDI